ncbi:hypothetical protein [Streptomyces sp. NPDC005336]|uniref:hypothetical protein n=1 Tax=Streptomyces sp. NPDC005336 TaxID=3157035 RepID=UPI00339FF683
MRPRPALARAKLRLGDRELARTVRDRLQPPPGGDLWAVRPAVEQLDSIALAQDG